MLVFDLFFFCFLFLPNFSEKHFHTACRYTDLGIGHAYTEILKEHMTKCTCFKNGYLFLLTSGFKLCCKLFFSWSETWQLVRRGSGGRWPKCGFVLNFFFFLHFLPQTGLIASSACRLVLPCCYTKKALAVLLREEALVGFWPGLGFL